MTLRVKLEIIPQGDESQAREIGRIDIFQKGKVQTDDGKELDDTRVYGVQGYDTIFVHKQSDGAWWLAQSVLFSLVTKGLKGP